MVCVPPPPRQALADIVNFARFITDQFGLSEENKWVTFGGSYPGMLAAWSRTKFPNVFHAAVSSSAPVIAQLDMTGYNDVVASALAVSDNGVGGSAACLTAVKTGHASIGALFATAAGRTRLSSVRIFPLRPEQCARRARVLLAHD